MKVLKVSLKGSGCSYFSTGFEYDGKTFDSMLAEEIKLLVSEGNLGDKLTLEVIEMSEEELAALPEFEGF